MEESFILANSESNFRKYLPCEKYISFFSNAKEPLNKLSNFHEALIKVFHNKYISTEHAFQSRKFLEPDQERFTIDGDLGSEDSFELLKINKEYWMKKKNIGIIAKMATNAKNIKLKKDKDFKSSWKLWKKILKAKFKIPEFREILLSTGDLYLLEFSRSSKKIENFWGGLIENNVLYGNNMMGKYLMKIRDKIKSK